MTLLADAPTAPIQEANLVHRPYHDRGDLLLFNPWLADLMLSIRQGHNPVTTRSTPNARPATVYASIAWKGPQGHWRRFHSEGGRYHCPPISPGTPVFDLDTQETWCNLVDKLLTAISYNCHLTARCHEGHAVLSWDRASHGNTPTIVLNPDDRITHYRDWPRYLPEHLEPPTTPLVPLSPFYDHLKPLHRGHNAPNRLRDDSPPPPTCQLDACPNPAPYNALDHRGQDEGPLCNFHLYGPDGFVHRPAFLTFRQWRDHTLQTEHQMLPIELAAHRDRAARWSAN